MLTLTGLFIGAAEGRFSMEIAPSDSVASLLRWLHAKFLAPGMCDPLALKVYVRASPSAEIPSDDWHHNPPTTDGELQQQQLLSPDQTMEQVLTSALPSPPTSQIDSDVPTLHVVVVPPAKRGRHPTRLARWNAINDVLMLHGGWPHDVLLLQNEYDGEQFFPAARYENRRRLDLLDALWKLSKPWKRKYTEPVMEIPAADQAAVSRVLSWGINVNSSILYENAMWTTLVTPIFWCAQQQFPDHFVVSSIVLNGRELLVRGIRPQFVLYNKGKQLLVIQELQGRHTDGFVHALLACELLADMYDDVHTVSAVVTDGTYWTFIRSLDDGVLYDESVFLQTDPMSRAPTPESLGAILGKLCSLLK